MKIDKIVRIIGWVYWALHVVMLTFFCVFIFLAITTRTFGWEAVVIGIPLLGMFVGNSLKKNIFDFWRFLVLLLSVVLSFGLVYLSFFLPKDILY